MPIKLCLMVMISKVMNGDEADDNITFLGRPGPLRFAGTGSGDGERVYRGKTIKLDHPFISSSAYS
jgi:hypothetical protein